MNSKLIVLLVVVAVSNHLQLKQIKIYQKMSYIVLLKFYLVGKILPKRTT